MSLLDERHKAEQFIATLEPIIESLEDLKGLDDLTTQDVEIIQGLIRDCDHQLQEAKNLLRAIDAMFEVDYPNIPTLPIPAGVLARWKDEVASVALGLTRFTPMEEAVSARIIVGEPTEKN